jgi:RNA polymerase-binding protein DksA
MPQPKNLFEVMRNMATMTRIPRKLFNALEKQLASQRDELRRRIDRHRMDVVMDREHDDETAAAVENVSRDILAATLERERRTLKEIESALARMEKGEYGTCDRCGVAIPKARLDALPWARLCIHCAESSLNSSGLRVAF